jgi:hypothetical protein
MQPRIVLPVQAALVVAVRLVAAVVDAALAAVVVTTAAAVVAATVVEVAAATAAAVVVVMAAVVVAAAAVALTVAAAESRKEAGATSAQRNAASDLKTIGPPSREALVFPRQSNVHPVGQLRIPKSHSNSRLPTPFSPFVFHLQQANGSNFVA